MLTCVPPARMSPGQAAKSRPLLKAVADRANATSAVAVIGPTPGIVIRRSALCIRLGAPGERSVQHSHSLAQQTQLLHEQMQDDRAVSGMPEPSSIAAIAAGLIRLPASPA